MPGERRKQLVAVTMHAIMTSELPRNVKDNVIILASAIYPRPSQHPKFLSDDHLSIHESHDATRGYPPQRSQDKTARTKPRQDILHAKTAKKCNTWVTCSGGGVKCQTSPALPPAPEIGQLAGRQADREEELWPPLTDAGYVVGVYTIRQTTTRCQSVSYLAHAARLSTPGP